MRQYVKLIVVVFLTITFGISCEKEEEKNPETDFIEYVTSHGEIGSGGGSVTITDPESETSGASLLIPEGAIEGIVRISMQIDNSIRPPGDSVSDIISLEPDRLSFNTPVTIKVPVDKSIQYPGFFYFDPDSSILRQIPIIEHNKEDEYITVQVSHFSKYLLGWPSKWTEYYYQNREVGNAYLPVPYYYQVNNWCAYYALSMATKYAGYGYKAPRLSTLLNLIGRTSTYGGHIDLEMIGMGNKLSSLGISVDIDRYWTNVTNMCGLILYELKKGHPVVVFSRSEAHAYVVTGYNKAGFLISNPNTLTSINEFMSFNAFEVLFGNGLLGAEHTIVVESLGNEPRDGYTLNFRGGLDLLIMDQTQGGSLTGLLELDTKHYPDGYAIVNYENEKIGFDGNNILVIEPMIANSYNINADLTLHVKIDKKNIKESPKSVSISAKQAKSDNSTKLITQLSNLTKGNHRIDVELRSLDSRILYDSWSFDLRIENEYNVFPPEADFQASSTSITEGQSVQFTDQSTNSPTSWTWDFGDGESSTEQNPSHTFNTAGKFTVTLAASNDHGSNTETKTNYITVNEIGSPPVADFTASKTVATINEEIQFTDQSTNNPTSWSWDFGDGSSSSQQNPLHTYSTSGSYTVELTASNESGSDTEIKQSYISINESGGGDSGIVFNPNLDYGSVTDIDGNIYNTIQIGDQVWMAENLRTTRYADGTAIPNIESKSGWDDLGYDDKAYCWHVNSIENRDLYGGLYTWPAAVNGTIGSDASPSGIQGICPDGWHLPSDAEWKELEMHLGMSQADVDSNSLDRGSDEGGQLKESGTSHWGYPNTGATNSSGFTALPVDWRYLDGSFGSLGNQTYFWTTTESDEAHACCRFLVFSKAGVKRVHGVNENIGVSVRCVKD